MHKSLAMASPVLLQTAGPYIRGAGPQFSISEIQLLGLRDHCKRVFATHVCELPRRTAINWEGESCS